MSSLHKQFKTDADKEVQGVLIQFEANDDGSKPGFRVRRRGGRNQEYQKALDRQVEQYKRQIEFKTLDEMVSRELLMRVFVDTVLVGWEHVQNESNEQIVYSKENALQLFRELPDLYQILMAESAKIDLFKSEHIEQVTKN